MVALHIVACTVPRVQMYNSLHCASPSEQILACVSTQIYESGLAAPNPC